MSSDEKDYHIELCRLAKGVVESINELSNRDVADELRENCINLETKATKIKTLMLQTIKAYKRSQLKEEYNGQVARIQSKKYEIPNTPEERRGLFMAVMAQQPDLKLSFTLQYRDFDQLTDSDIESVLRQLQELEIEVML